MTHLCPECGAPPREGLDCREQLAWLIGWEQDDEALAALHFYTVASYNLQHPSQFTDETLTALRTLFIEAVDQRLSNSEVRRRAVERGIGEAKILRPAGDRHPVLRHWPLTIADVYRPDQPEGAAERVWAWARSIRLTPADAEQA